MKHGNKVIWIAWERHQRSIGIARALNARLYAFVSRRSRWLKHPAFTLRTIATLWRERPGVVIVQNPSIVLALLTLILRPLLRYRVVSDAHNAAINPYGELTRHLGVLYRFVQRHADLTIVTNAALGKVVEENGGHPFILPDAIPAMPPASGPAPRPPSKITFICTFAEDEPWKEAIAAADLLPPGVVLHVTGKPGAALRPASRRVRLTGYLPDDEYVSLLAASDVIMDLTWQADCLVCGAYEAVAVGVPLVVSDSAVLRAHFRRGTVYTRNDSASIASAMAEALDRRKELRKEMVLLRQELTVEWQERFVALCSFVAGV